MLYVPKPQGEGGVSSIRGDKIWTLSVQRVIIIGGGTGARIGSQCCRPEPAYHGYRRLPYIGPSGGPDQ